MLSRPIGFVLLLLFYLTLPLVTYVGTLARHPDQFVSRACHDNSTSNLKRHIVHCATVPDAEAAGQLTMPMFAGGSTYSESKLCLYIVEWCACNNRPMMIVEDKAFVKMLRMMNANIVIPGCKAVSRDIKAVYNISKVHVKRIIAATPGCLHEMTDGWSSPNVLSVLGVATSGKMV